MKFTISSSALLSLLATTGKVISNKSSLPILEYFLMDLKDGVLTVTTSDLETTLIGSISVENVEQEGTIAAPAKLMLDSLKEFAEMPLTIEVNDTTWEIKITWASGHLSIPGASAVSYPAVQSMAAESKNLTLDVDLLVSGINKTIFATADDELRPVMNGVYFDFSPESLTFVATDAHKLVKCQAEHASDITSSFILPKKPANLLKALLAKEEEPVNIAFDAKNVTFDGCTFNCAGKSVLVYAEGSSNGSVVTFNGCKLNATAPVEGKAAIEIDSSLIKGEYVVNINETEAKGFANGNVSGNSLWNNKKGDKTSVYVDGTQVL